MKHERPSVDQWLREAKADPAAAGCGMLLVHNGIDPKQSKHKRRTLTRPSFL